jgi:hypothetical protein
LELTTGITVLNVTYFHQNGLNHMNNIPNAGSANNMGSAQRTANATPAQGRTAAANGNGPQRPATVAAAEIGTQAVKQGVRFSNTATDHVQRQIRTYNPDLPAAISLDSALADTAPRQPTRSADTAPRQPTRSADSKPVDTAPSLPKRSSD